MKNENTPRALAYAFAFGVVVAFSVVVLAPFFIVVDTVNALKAGFGRGGA